MTHPWKWGISILFETEERNRIPVRPHHVSENDATMKLISLACMSPARLREEYWNRLRAYTRIIQPLPPDDTATPEQHAQAIIESARQIEESRYRFLLTRWYIRKEVNAERAQRAELARRAEGRQRRAIQRQGAERRKRNGR